VTVEGSAHHFIDHVNRRQRCGVNREQTISFCYQLDFSLPRLILPDNTFAGQSRGQNGRCLIFMYFVIGQVNGIEMVFSQFLKMAQVIIADRMPHAEGRSLEHAGTDFGDIVGKFSPHCIF